MDISLSCTLSPSVSAPSQHTLHLVQLYKHEMFLIYGFYSPTTPHTTYPTCMAYSIWGDNFFRFNCPWTNVDISIHCIMSYYTVSITLLLSVPCCFSLSCTPLQVVSGQEKPVKHNFQPWKEVHLLSKYTVALPVGLTQQSWIAFSKHKALRVSIQHISHPVVLNTKLPKVCFGQVHRECPKATVFSFHKQGTMQTKCCGRH